MDADSWKASFLVDRHDLMRSRHFRCGCEERELLSWLDGTITIEGLHEKFRKAFPNQMISIATIRSIISSAAGAGLLLPAAKGHEAIARQSGRSLNTANKWLGVVESWPWNWIQTRVNLGSPDRVAKYLAVHTDWLFSSTAVRCWLFLIFFSLLAVLNRLVTESSNWTWPALQDWISQGGTFAAILFVTRIVHEMGHAVVAARYGAKCRESGVIFMLGVMCPFVDVTDSWRLPKKAERMAVASAGVYMECILASIAGLVWCFTKDGLVHDFCWQITLTCSMMTLIVNANPLMRYDGYFVLCDYMESANLRDEAQKAWGRILMHGSSNPLPSQSDRQISLRDCWLVVFALFQIAYRSTVVTTIAISVYLFLREWELKWLGICFGGLVFVSFALIPMMRWMMQSIQSSQAISNDNRMYRYRSRLVLGWALVSVVILSIPFVPLPYRIACKGIVEPKGKAVCMPGHLVFCEVRK